MASSPSSKRKGARRRRAAAPDVATLQAGLDRLPIGFALFDAKRRLIAWNSALASIYGYPESFLAAGTPVEQFLRFNARRGDYGQGKIAALVRKRAALVAGRKAIVRDQRLTDGRTLRISTRSVPSGYRLITWEDVTEARLAEERYSVASRAVNEGIYDWDITRGKIYYSERVYEALGFTARDYRTVAGWRKRIHPEDLPRFTSGVVAHLKGESERFECDYRFRTRDGTWRWARQHGIALRDASGRAIRMIGSTGDITELKHAEEALRSSEERYELALRAAAGIYDWDVTSGALYLSPRAKEVWGFPDGPLVNTMWLEHIHPDDRAGYRQAVIDHFKGRTPSVEHEFRARGADGTYLWAHDRGICVRDGHGHAVRLVGTMNDVTARKLAEEELRQAHEEATAALQRQTATAEILRVISSTSTDTQPVFNAIVKSTQRLMSAKSAILLLRRGNECFVAAYSVQGLDAIPPGIRTVPLDPAKNYPSRVVLHNEVVHLPDWQGEGVIEFERRVAQAYGIGSGLQVPLTRKGEGIGVLIATRETKGAFSNKEIALLQSFADQAVIAIENVRLFNETKEALERQTATAEILRVISSTPTDTQPVFDAIVAMAFKLFSCSRSAVLLRKGDHFSSVAICTCDGVGKTLVVIGDIKIDPSDNFPSRVIVAKRLLHLADWSKIELSAHEHRVYDAGTRASLMVPLLREDNCIGVLAFLRAEPIAFDEKEIELAQSFADQAVIAIENVRLFNETKEALERQTATADVLKAISRTTFDLDVVLGMLLESATRLSGAERAILLRPDDNENYLPAAQFNYPADSPLLARLSQFPLRPGRDSTTGRALLERRIVHVSDVLADAEYRRMDLVGEGEYRTVAAVPMLRDGDPTGLITFTKNDEGRGFSEKQLQLMATFADQAAIAIENVRLFHETKEALEQQKASGEVLSVISSSIADAQPVFDKITESCERLFAGFIVGLNLVGDDGLIRNGAYHGPGREGFSRIFPLPVNSESGSGLAIVEARVVHYPDAQHGEEVPQKTRVGCSATGIRSVIFAPVLWQGRGIGAIFVGRDFVSSFSDKEIALLRTFCDQAAIAIQNARLFREIQDKSHQLEIASQHKSQFLASMSHELRTPLNAILGFNEMILDGVYGELAEDLRSPLENMQTSGKHLLRLINNVLDLAKIEAGRMELALSDYSVQDTVASVHSTLKPLAAEKGLDFVAHVPGDLPLAYGDGGRIAQCLMNLAGNSLKFTKAGKVEIGVEQIEHLLRYRVSDTGIGIPADKIGSLFTEFKQTDATIASEYGGTGLGLSISRKFIEMHGGRIWVESEPGKGSTFLFEVPLRVAS